MEDLLKEFVPYDRALRMKSLGFDEPCFGFWKSNIKYQRFISDYGCNSDLGVMFGKEAKLIPTAPTFSRAFRWFREKYGLYSWVKLHNGYIDDSFYKKLPITWTIMEHESGKQYYERDTDHNYLYHAHEEAELACLDKLLEIVESKLE